MASLMFHFGISFVTESLMFTKARWLERLIRRGSVEELQGSPRADHRCIVAEPPKFLRCT